MTALSALVLVGCEKKDKTADASHPSDTQSVPSSIESHRLDKQPKLRQYLADRASEDAATLNLLKKAASPNPVEVTASERKLQQSLGLQFASLYDAGMFSEAVEVEKAFAKLCQERLLTADESEKLALLQAVRDSPEEIAMLELAATLPEAKKKRLTGLPKLRAVILEKRSARDAGGATAAADEYVRVLQAVFGKEHLEYGKGLLFAGSVSLEMGKSKESLAMLRESEGILRKTLKEGDKRLTGCRTVIEMVELAGDGDKEQMTLFEQTERLEKAYRKKVDGLGAQADQAAEQGDFRLATKLTNEEIQLLDAGKGEMMRISKEVALIKKWRYAEVAEDHDEIEAAVSGLLAMSEQEHGPNHWNTKDTKLALDFVRRKKAWPASEKEAYQAAGKKLSEVWGGYLPERSDEFERGMSANSFLQPVPEVGKTPDLKSDIRIVLNALAVYQRLLNPASNEIISTRYALAEIYMREGETDSALKSCKENFKVIMDALGISHPELARCFWRLGRIASRQKPEDAEKLFLKAVSLEQTERGKDGPAYMRYVHSLGDYYEQRKDPRAGPLLREAAQWLADQRSRQERDRGKQAAAVIDKKAKANQSPTLEKAAKEMNKAKLAAFLGNVGGRPGEQELQWAVGAFALAETRTARNIQPRGMGRLGSRRQRHSTIGALALLVASAGRTVERDRGCGGCFVWRC